MHLKTKYWEADWPDRSLNEQEIAELIDNPYAFFQERPDRTTMARINFSNSLAAGLTALWLNPDQPPSHT